MESKLQIAARSNYTGGKEVYVAPIAKLRDPNHESELARFHKIGGVSANMVCNRILFSILDNHQDGGIIGTAKEAILDIERMETRGEAFVYDTDGKLVHLEDGLPLGRSEDCFRASARRTMSRFLKKADTPSKQCVDRRLLPMMFWIDASRKIMERR